MDPTTTDGTPHRTSRRLASRIALVGVALAVPLAAAGCSSSSSSATTTTTAASTTTTVSPVQTAKIKALQIALAALGCYSGAIDGIQGSATSQAIKEFQKAAGLTVDGIYGTVTNNTALADVKTGRRICASSSTTTTTTVPSTTTTSSTSSTTTTTSTTTTLPSSGAAPAQRASHQRKPVRDHRPDGDPDVRSVLRSRRS